MPPLPPSPPIGYHPAVTLPPPSHGVIADGAHHLMLRVYFEDTDTAGIVYHASYLRFMERGRTEMLRAAGIDHGAAVAAGLGAYAVHDMTIRWHRPAVLDDVLRVTSRLTRVRAAACSIAQDIWRGDTLITTATLTAAFLAPDGRPRRQPAEWMLIFNNLQEHAG
ncbi:YbgC/FadM family acyl-CoA thioesterase [Sandarakinorhabdus sp.]|uniref:YbgC/FadM family acyl-CoA thioesterase n=1 Tax=Sandarakinorhabdus sp. TaxID=1916663 RepID=UPI00286DC44B|nr:YbgC/FadM family acyl-CoA thioesterase [Sandarakinorhabdus sp.]